jgi:hypothetical protein
MNLDEIMEFLRNDLDKWRGDRDIGNETLLKLLYSLSEEMRNLREQVREINFDLNAAVWSDVDS